MNTHFRQNQSRIANHQNVLRRRVVCGAAGAVLSLATAAGAQPAAGMLNMTFEDNRTGFIAFGEGAKVGINRDAAFVRNGNAALQFDYSINKSGFQAMLMPTVGGLATMESLKFWIRADHTSPMAVALQEGEAGARYIAIFTTPKDTWQQVELAPEDFHLMDDANAPKDPNNKLDLDQVMFVAIGDFGQFLLALSEAAPAPFAGAFNVQAGAHALHIDDFTIDTRPLPRPVLQDGEAPIDLFAHPQLAWVGIGGVHLQRTEAPLQGRPVPGMKIGYQQVPNKMAAVFTRIGKGRLSGAGSVKLQLSSERATTLAIQLEEAGGGKYYATVDAKGGAEVQSVEIGFDNFKESDDSKDQNHQLNPEQVQQLLVIDAATFLGQAENKGNTLWLGNLRAAQ
ncbi:MAG: hypothetical protein JWN98_1105 [Abditibacteriota bacterium]|nr:hypothetical protein [Abditibacteriota bacterium]